MIQHTFNQVPVLMRVPGTALIAFKLVSDSITGVSQGSARGQPGNTKLP